MTLNITITTKRRIYQCADFRLTDFRTGETRDFGANQKIHLVSRAGWHALVCFFGVGSTPGFLVGDWLAKQLGSIQYQDTLDVLLQKLREADAWLRSIPHVYAPCPSESASGEARQVNQSRMFYYVHQ